MKLFVGHAGWGPGQLESEIEQAARHTLPATPDEIFADPQDLWQRLVHAVAGPSLSEMLGIKHVPEDPSLN